MAFDAFEAPKYPMWSQTKKPVISGELNRKIGAYLATSADKEAKRIINTLVALLEVSHD